jgi:putative transposase
VFPSTREQRCWVHRTANCLDVMPKRVHPEAKAAIADIYGAETRADALVAVQSFADRFAEFPKATAKITGELDTLLAFFDFPAEHWVHLRSTDDSFKARVALSAGWDGVSLVGGRGRPRSQE